MQKLPEVAASFADNAKRLDTLISVETYVGIQRMNDDQYSAKGKYIHYRRI